uniref:Uncharacterized protein n=1 Tax=Rhizophora mucronata TaxID=61149 RepID=A0A2P2NJX4_RHIMU
MWCMIANFTRIACLKKKSIFYGDNCTRGKNELLQH